MGKRVLRIQALAVVAISCAPAFAHADPPASPTSSQTDTGKEETTGLVGGPGMTLDPTAPVAAALPGGMTPAFGQKSMNPQDWRFDFHGYITAPLTLGVNSRPDAGPGQSTTVLHSPPVVPDNFETFSHTSVVPTTYAQLNFSESNGVLSANVSVVAMQTDISESFLEPADQLGITDAFLSYLPDLGRHVQMRVLVGAFSTRYGAMGEYDEGRYGTPLIATINGIGELVTARMPFDDYTLLLEEGIQGQTNTPGASITPDVWNDFADPEEGTTFVDHFHAGVGYRSLATLGAHFINAQSHDDRATGTLEPDGNVNVFGADLRLTMGRFGHFYAAFAETKASHARTISRILSILNTPGGEGLEDNYLGSDAAGGDGTGSLTTVGGQYDLSIGRLVSWPVPFKGDGPDVFVSAFGMMTHVTSALPGVNGGIYGNVTKAKYGLEATYSLLPWLALSARYDQVAPNTADNRYSFSVISPRIIFRTNWNATDQVVLQYSHWFDGGLTLVQTGDPPTDSPLTVPDSDVLSISASMWW
ncbi:MAG TPA: hypothetical protein VEK07_00720 [Polyangiaceae bacterium]|nr:hypothetical protein [Polyangiaceae bacterium]